MEPDRKLLKMFELEEFRLWLIDRFEPEELMMYLDLNTEEILEAFPELWENNKPLLEMYGVSLEEEEEDD
jgi:hypothetical protein